MATTAEGSIPAPSAAVVGAGVAGLACASALARLGMQVIIFEMGRGPGGRMSQRRATAPDGTELRFDHGAQYFTVSEPAVRPLVDMWLAEGVVADWTGRFGELDAATRTFSLDKEKRARYVGVPGMNAMCKAMASLPDVTARYGSQVGRIEKGGEGRWSLTSPGGESLGSFDAVACSDKNVASSKFTALTGLPPPLDFAGVPEMRQLAADVESAPCFAAMLAFPGPLTEVPFEGARVVGSTVLSWIARDSSKPGRSYSQSGGGSGPECWVLHSTEAYARKVIDQLPKTGKPSADALAAIATEMLVAFREAVEGVPATPPVFSSAHRWGGAFPKSSIAGADKCVVDESGIALCGDFCAGPKIEFAILSGLRAAEELSKLVARR